MSYDRIKYLYYLDSLDIPKKEKEQIKNKLFGSASKVLEHSTKLPSKDEVLHHIDLDKHNNNFNNLFLCNHKEHIKIHRSLEKLIPELLKRKIIKFENGEYIII